MYIAPIHVPPHVLLGKYLCTCGTLPPIIQVPRARGECDRAKSQGRSAAKCSPSRSGWIIDLTLRLPVQHKLAADPTWRLAGVGVGIAVIWPPGSACDSGLLARVRTRPGRDQRPAVARDGTRGAGKWAAVAGVSRGPGAHAAGPGPGALGRYRREDPGHLAPWHVPGPGSSAPFYS